MGPARNECANRFTSSFSRPYHSDSWRNEPRDINCVSILSAKLFIALSETPNKLLYRPVYPAKTRYTRKGTLCAGIKLCKMVAVSTLLLPIQLLVVSVLSVHPFVF